MFQTMLNKTAIALSMIGFTLAGIAQYTPNRVYTMTNAASGNQVIAFDRASNGALTEVGRFATGGNGTGAGLGSQGSLILSSDNEFLFAVNAGSNDVSVFKVTQSGLFLVDKKPSGGTMPISLTNHRNWLYVLNAGGEGNIPGFNIGRYGQLSQLPGSTRPLSSSASGPAQVQFSPGGLSVVVTEKMTNKILIYNVVPGTGYLNAPRIFNSSGQTPFGFAFDNDNNLIVSEAAGGAANASTVSSYNYSYFGLLPVSGAVPTTQTAACWVAIPRSVPYAFTTNTGSSSVSSYRINIFGGLTLQSARAGNTGAGTSPIDAGFSTGDRYLYVLTGGNPSITTFELSSGGSLINRGSLTVPAGSVGLAVQ